MRKSLTYVALLATMVVAACSDSAKSPTAVAAPIDPAAITQQTLSSYIDGLITSYYTAPKALIVRTQWNVVKARLAAGDVQGARRNLIGVVVYIVLNTNSIIPPAGETKQKAAGRLIRAMLIYVFVGPGAPVPQPIADPVVQFVPAGQPARIITPSGRAGLDLEAGSTNEDRFISISQQQYPGDCNGPLPTVRCQYPQFYQFESFPHLKLNKPGHFAVCMDAGARKPIDVPGLENTHQRMQLAHPTPANVADRTPGSTYVDGIELLPHATVQKGIITCERVVEAPTGTGIKGFAERVLYAVNKAASRIFSPKNAYAYDQGPEHLADAFSPFNGVDPGSRPDLSVGSLNLTDGAVNPGAIVPVAFTVSNRSLRVEGGHATATSFATTATLYLSRNTSLDEGDVNVGTVPIGELAPDESQAVTTSITAPTAGGQWYIIVDVAESVGGTPLVHEYTTENNSTYGSLNVIQPEVPLVLNASTAAMTTGETRNFYVVTGSSSPYIWSVNGSDAPSSALGTLLVNENYSVDYTAPSTVPEGPLTLCARRSAVPTNQACVVVTVSAPPPIEIPNPILAYRHSEQYSTGGLDWDRYTLTVTNRAAFPASMFAPAPDLPPCGLNTSSSQSWVDIYDGTTNARIYGFCGLGSPADLNDIWIAVLRWTQPPASVYIKITDRRANIVYTSNSVNLYGPLFVNFPRVVILNWSAVAGANYDIEVDHCEGWDRFGDWRVCTGTAGWISDLRLFTWEGGTSYTHSFVGDQPGRWRVRPMDVQGVPLGPWSDYKFFNYITGPDAP